MTFYYESSIPRIMNAAAKRFAEYLEGPPKRTQEAFAKKIGASQVSVSAWKDGKKSPSRGFAVAIQAETGIEAALWPKIKRKPKPAPKKRAA